MILDTTSLVKTLDNINEIFLFGKTINLQEGLEATRWIVSQNGKKGSYRNLPSPTPFDFEQGIRLFTGEQLFSASSRHIMGQEAARVIWLLGRQDPLLREAYDRATAWMHDVPDFQQSGTFCCGRCTLAFWRHYWIGNFNNKEELVLKGLMDLKNSRIGDGKWRRFPFFYAIYSLAELDLEPARAELIYARPRMERYLKNPRTGVYSQRRITIFKKVLEKID